MWLRTPEGEAGKKGGAGQTIHCGRGVAVMSSCWDLAWKWVSEVKQKNM